MLLGALLVLMTALAVLLNQKPSQPLQGTDDTAIINKGGGGGGGGGGIADPGQDIVVGRTTALTFDVLLERGRDALKKGDVDHAAKEASAARNVARDTYQKKRLDNLDHAIQEAKIVKNDENVFHEAESIKTESPLPVAGKTLDLPIPPVEKPKDIHTAGEIWREPKTGIEMVFIPSGEFLMGSNSGNLNESPSHMITVRGFWMGKSELTQGQWKSVAGDNPSRFKNGDMFPVETVSWDKVKEFIRKLNELTGEAFRLPTEAEWEFACRSGRNNDRYGDLEDIAWYRNNSNEQTHAVGEKKANPWGLVDMLGNVWEWCEDFYEEDYYKKSDTRNPKGPTSGEYRVIRGGSWFRPAEFIRAMCRNHAVPGLKNDNLGFRLAKD